MSASAGSFAAVAHPQPAFLTASWRYLLMLNYPVDPAALRPFTPPGVELDLWRGEALVSLVGFLFLDTRLRGVAIPWHRDFEEVNLRFYVRRRDGQAQGGWRRGVVFVKEIVPRPAIAWVARLAYGERYVALPMRHTLWPGADADAAPSLVEYAWRHRGRWHRLGARPTGPAQPLVAGSEEAFITEHYWGYALRRGRTVEYAVEHPPWRVWQVADAWFVGDAGRLYGAAFAEALAAPPASAFLAEGSPVTVRRGSQLDG
ncbi:MAG: DUF2071 domain-containing protein [Caldilineales bacterium]|nr:DUF2071 domain-containing protein [Caldilineales bacterium]MDW8318279.1 DUF2071 domain-containing protein [Anaerolineae bacterium]